LIGDELKSGSSALAALLFGPVFLAAEFVGNIFPGLIFYLVLILKKNPLACALFELPFLGYRAKLVVALFVAFVIGKLLGTPYAMLQAGVFPGNSAVQLEKVKRPKGQELILHLVVGAVVMPSLIGKSRLMDYLAIANAGVYFSFSSGLALMIASAIPGDGQAFRIIELVVGVLFIVAGYVQATHFATALVAFAGMSLREFVEKIPAASLPAMVPAITALFQYINKPPDQPKKPTEPTAQLEPKAMDRSGAGGES
jgi:hypothetical protein